MKCREFLQKMFSESGEVSFARVITAFIVFFVLGWDTSYSAHFHAIPPSTDLLGQAAFMSVFYGVNKFTGGNGTPVPPEVPKP